MMVELIKFANAQTSLICEAALGNVSPDGKAQNKVLLTLVMRDAQNRAVKTLKYYLDIPLAKVLCHDLWTNALTNELNEYKKTNKAERALKITPKAGGYRLAIMNTIEAKRESLYFDLTQWQVRQMAVMVLDHIRAYEFARSIYQVKPVSPGAKRGSNPGE